MVQVSVRRARHFQYALASVWLAFGVTHCGSDKGGSSTGGQGGSDIVIGMGGGAGSGQAAGSDNGSAGTTAVWPPAGYVNVTDTNLGAYALGPELSDTGGSGAAGSSGGDSKSPDSCGGLFAVVRDFKLGNQTGGHPDFETAMGDDPGIVADQLGADSKPVYAHAGKTRTTNGQADFDQWYRDVPEVNRTFALGLHLVENKGVLTFQADQFFPLDGQGFGNEGLNHNFAFTTEIHTTFRYNGGETFTFIGDDDVFGFINGRLVIDLGGVHNAETRRVVLDQVSASLGLTKGSVYDLAVFHAERHTVESHFRIDTTLTFLDCGTQPNGAPIR